MLSDQGWLKVQGWLSRESERKQEKARESEREREKAKESERKPQRKSKSTHMHLKPLGSPGDSMVARTVILEDT